MLYKRATLIQDIKEVIQIMYPTFLSVMDLNAHLGYDTVEQVFLWVVQHYIEKMDGRQIKGHLFRNRDLENIYSQLNEIILTNHFRSMEELFHYYIQIPTCLYQFQTIELQVEIKSNDLYIYFLQDEHSNHFPNLTNNLI